MEIAIRHRNAMILGFEEKGDAVSGQQETFGSLYIQ